MFTCKMPSNLGMPLSLRSLRMTSLPPERVGDNCAAETPEIWSVASNQTVNVGASRGPPRPSSLTRSGLLVVSPEWFVENDAVGERQPVVGRSQRSGHAPSWERPAVGRQGPRHFGTPEKTS